MIRRNLYRKLMVGMLMAACFSMAVPQQQAEAAEYKRAVTYFSDAWVSNFWNTESDHMDEELAQIASDGFNSIILVVPWREFQPTVLPASYNAAAFRKLDRVMRTADAHGLKVMLRVGYAWDYYSDDASIYRFRDLLKDNSTRNAWIAYARRLYDTVSAYPNYAGGFMTWEDFWNYVEDISDLGVGKNSRDEAKKNGYQAYLKEHYSLSEINESYGSSTDFKSYDEIYIPRKGHYSYRLFFEFYDNFLNELLADTQKVFPDLSMEVRLDVDPVEGKNDGDARVGVPHDSTFPCGNSSYTSLMYSVSMGRGAGNILSAGEAIGVMNEQLSLVREKNGGKPIFIDQLLYMDMTEGFQDNAKLADNQRAPFLTALPDTLRTYTNGYAVWTYRDYGNNPIYNCQFAQGNQGWTVSNASIEEREGSNWMRLNGGGSISQKVGHRISGKNTHSNHVRFSAYSEGPVTLRVALGRNEQQVEIDGSGQFDLDFGPVSYYDVSFAADGTVWLDNTQVYNFVQDGQLRDMDGGELSCLPAVRTLNGAMN